MEPADAGTGDGRDHEPDQHRQDDRRREAENPGHADEQSGHADQQPGGNAEIAQPPRG
jgi:hypothetical protein